MPIVVTYKLISKSTLSSTNFSDIKDINHKFAINIVYVNNAIAATINESQLKQNKMLFYPLQIKTHVDDTTYVHTSLHTIPPFSTSGVATMFRSAKGSFSSSSSTGSSLGGEIARRGRGGCCGGVGSLFCRLSPDNLRAASLSLPFSERTRSNEHMCL